MRSTPLTVVLLAGVTAVATASSACAKRTTAGAPTKVVRPAAPAPVATVEERRARPRETAVYVDGVQKGILRMQELPPSFKAHDETQGGEPIRRWYWAEYARAIGVDLAKVRAVHFHGGARTSIVSNAELARVGKDLAFSFTRDDGGKPQMQWPSKKLNVSTLIDMLSAVAFYVEKEPPHLDDDGVTLRMPDGTDIGENLAYTNPEQGTGTRVYVDGALVDTVKRKRLTNDLLAGGGLEGGETSKFSLALYAKKLGIDPAKAKAVDVVAGDDVIARLPAAKTADVTFDVPRHNRGHAMVGLPTDVGSREARVSAIQFFVKATPPSRKLTTIDDAPEAQKPSGERAGSGGGSGDGDE